ncbi:ATP-binding protein [Actinomadura hibisca]|uniref:ATP-binding protein n=1 Tax=Actinomadura hibisca TaxID=68565 RepID=UPI000AF83F0C|nr:ATP-binding protein [Actinomadura hibisca]
MNTSPEITADAPATMPGLAPASPDDLAADAEPPPVDGRGRGGGAGPGAPDADGPDAWALGACDAGAVLGAAAGAGEGGVTVTGACGRPGRVWALPRGPGCASHARRALAGALAGLGVPPDVVGDAKLMVSELATNAYQHAGEHGPHELWLYLGEPIDGGDAGPQVEVRCAVFDAHAEARLPGYSWTSGDCGRGLSIVRELSKGRWGTLRSTSRLGARVPGKAVWFAVPAPAPATL